MPEASCRAYRTGFFLPVMLGSVTLAQLTRPDAAVLYEKYSPLITNVRLIRVGLLHESVSGKLPTNRRSDNALPRYTTFGGAAG